MGNAEDDIRIDLPEGSAARRSRNWRGFLGREGSEVEKGCAGESGAGDVLFILNDDLKPRGLMHWL